MDFKDRALFIEDQMILNLYRTRIMSAALAEFQYGNVPNTCDFLYAERKALENGWVAMYRPKGSDVLVTTAFAQQGEFTGYGRPAAIVGIDYMGRQYETDDFEILYDNNLRISLMPYIDLYARILWEIHQTFRSNLAQQITPRIAITTKDAKLSYENLFNDIYAFRKAIVVSKGMDIKNTVTSLESGGPFIGLQLLQALDFQWRNVMNMLGITTGTTKKERENSKEVVMNLVADAISMQSRLGMRVDFVNRANRRWGLDMTVNMASVDSYLPNIGNIMEATYDMYADRGAERDDGKEADDG